MKQFVCNKELNIYSIESLNYIEITKFLIDIQLNVGSEAQTEIYFDIMAI